DNLDRAIDALLAGASRESGADAGLLEQAADLRTALGPAPMDDVARRNLKLRLLAAWPVAAHQSVPPGHDARPWRRLLPAWSRSLPTRMAVAAACLAVIVGLAYYAVHPSALPQNHPHVATGNGSPTP